jgi:hypothetical protein
MTAIAAKVKVFAGFREGAAEGTGGTFCVDRNLLDGSALRWHVDSVITGRSARALLPRWVTQRI